MRRWTVVCVWVVGFLQVAPLAAEPPRAGRALLFGGAVTPSKSPVRLDPVLPRGELLGLGPVMEEPSACSSRRPVCVRIADPNTAAPGPALEMLERAWEEHALGASLPAPLATFLSPLVWAPSPRPLKVLRRTRPSRGFDRATASCSGGETSLETARRCVTQAALYGQSPATASWLAQGLGAEVAIELGEAPHSRAELATSFQHPHVGVLTSARGFSLWREPDAPPHRVSLLRSARFFRYLEARSEAGDGSAAWLSLSLAATTTRPGASRWEAEPDLLDVLAATLGGDDTALARLLDDFARHSVSDAASTGAQLGYSWRVSSSGLPRNLALSEPMDPTGTSYVRLDLDAPDRDRVYAFRMNCEAPVSYVWSVVRLGPKDEFLSSVEIAYRNRGGDAEARILPLPQVATLVLVGTNMGGIDLAHPFDPDHEPHETHGCQIYISAVPY